jgi:hypothetical protein
MLTGALFAVVVAATPMQNAPRAPALVNAEACLREKTAEAVRVSSGATDAANFLVTYLCARPISAAAAWSRNTAMLENMKSMLDGVNQVTAQANTQVEEANVAPEDHDAAEMEAGLDFFGQGLEGVTVDQTTGNFIISGEASGIAANMVRTQTGALAQFFDDPTPVFLRELAGQLVLEHSPRR